MSESKAGRGVSSGEGRGRTNKSKMGSRGRSEGLSSQAKITYNHCQKPGHIRPNCPEGQCFKCREWGHDAVSCPSKGSNPKENGDKEKKGESTVMVVNQEPFSEVTAENKLAEIDGGGATCFMSVEIKKEVPPVEELPPVNTRNL